MKFNILELKIISQEVLQYYINNPEIAKEDYKKITTNNRGLDKTILDGYYEIHHVIPKCMGGTSEDNNLVLLTYEEHIKAHMLLYAINLEVSGLMIAFKSMLAIKSIHNVDLEADVSILSKLKEEFSDYISGDNNPMRNPEVVMKFKGENNPSKTKEVREKHSKILKESNPMKNPKTVEKMRRSKLGVKATRESRLNQSLSKMGRKMSEEQKKLISDKRKTMGIHLSEESKTKMRESKNSRYKGPDGTIYNSLSSAARSVGVSRTTIKNWIDNYPEKGFIKIL